MADYSQIAKDLNLADGQLDMVDGNIIAVVHEKWLAHIMSKQTVPKSSERFWPEWHMKVSVAFGVISKPWVRVNVQVIEASPTSCVRVPVLSPDSFSPQQNFFQFLGAIASGNYKKQWERSYRKGNSLHCQLGQEQCSKFQNIPIISILRKIYGCHIIQGIDVVEGSAALTRAESPPYDTSPVVAHGNLVPVLCAVTTSSTVYLLQCSLHYSMQQCTTFSPAMLANSYAKPLYVIYQLLQSVDIFHRLGLACGNINLSDFTLQENLWVQFRGPRWCEKLQEVPVVTDTSASNNRVAESNEMVQFLKEVQLTNFDKLSAKSISEITRSWVLGEISNFDYLMILNYLAGRRINNPNFHPILPWVCDFSSKDGGYRDFSKSKYRLNKGDQHLDMMYDSSHMVPEQDMEMGLNKTKHIPHHIAGMLADITYYVYKSRRTSKTVLCNHVRPKWVPEEYPISMQRMQEWTPDECIPEFFCDPMIFKSIHEDLPDLELPGWCQNEEEFIEWHRSILESDYVSERLHRWIDLTFGYKLSGGAAKKAMNVFLHLMDGHTTPIGHGVVQLFHAPHPRKLSSSPYLGIDAPSITRTVLKAPVEGALKSSLMQEVTEVSPAVDVSKVISDTTTETSSGSRGAAVVQDQTGSNQTESAEALPAVELSSDSMDSSKEKMDFSSANRQSTGGDLGLAGALQPLITDDNQILKNPIKKLPFFRGKSDPSDKIEQRPEDTLIKLPDDYDPLAALNHVESLFSFSSKSLHGVPDTASKVTREEDFDQLVQRDMLALGCTIAELFLTSKVRAQYPRIPLEERKMIIKRTLQTEWQEIPRPCREIIETLLKIEVTSSSRELRLPVQPYTTSFLLSPYSGVVPFPTYVSVLHQLAKELSEVDATISQLTLRLSLDPSVTLQVDSMERRKVHIARRWMPEVLTEINEEGKDILLLYLVELFKNQKTGLFALIMLFNKLAQFLGPKKSTEHCLPIIKSVFEANHSSSHFILLYHRSFLSQLMVRLGTRVFLKHVVQYVVMATNGMKECPLHSSDDEPWVPNGYSQNSEVVQVSSDSGLMGDTENREDLCDDGDVFDITGLGSTGSIEREAHLHGIDSKSLEKEGSISDDDESESISFDESSLSEYAPVNSETTSVNSAPFIGGTAEFTDGDETSLGEEKIPHDAERRSLSSVSLDDKRNSLVDENNVSKAETNSLGAEEYSSNPDVSSDKKHSTEEGDDLNLVVNSGDNSNALTPDLTQSRLYSHHYPVNSLADLPPNTSLSEVSCQSVKWLAKRLGPSLTGHFITRRLLEALCECYVGQQQVEHPQGDAVDSFDDMYLVGDSNAVPVIQCLMDVVQLYGDQFIFQQYIPFIIESVPTKKKKILMKHESNLIACMALLTSILRNITEMQLNENRQMVTKHILYPVINLVSSLNHIFPSGYGTRSSLCRKLVASITTMALRLGRERGRNELKNLLQYFFLSFDVINSDNSSLSGIAPTRKVSSQSTDSDDFYIEIKKDSLTDQYKLGTPTRLDDLKGELSDSQGRSPSAWSPGLTGIMEGSDTAAENKVKQEAKLQLEQVFTPEMAYIAYVPLCRLIGNIHMENTIPNHDLIWKLYSAHEKVISSSSGQQAKEKSKELVVGGYESTSDESVWGFGRNVSVTGNRIDINAQEAGTSLPASQGIADANSRNDDLVNSRELKGAWLHSWEQFIARKEENDSFHLSQMKLQTFTGHTGGIKALQVMPNENSFASASRDKTVKLWSLRNYGDGSANVQCQFTYPHHKKTVFALNYLESQRLIASCDGNVYVWDPFGSGAALRGYDLSRSVPTCMVAMPPPNPVLLMSTPDATVRIIDIRHAGLQHELKVSAGPLGLIRCLSVSPDGYTLGVGLSSGVLSLVDLRTGLLLGGWRAHEGEILQVKSHANRSFVTSSVDSTMSLWKEDGTKVCAFRGVVEPVSFLCLSNNQIISATTSCRIGIHTSIDEQANFSSTKVRSDVVKGVVSAMDVLPLNKLFLLGTDNGQITLVA